MTYWSGYVNEAQKDGLGIRFPVLFRSLGSGLELPCSPRALAAYAARLNGLADYYLNNNR
jgi:hypothetical protein